MGPSDGSLTGHLKAQVRENQALLRSFDAVVNRLQTALDAKDSAAAALRREHAALEDSNARLAARLDRALAPPPGAGGGDAIGSMLSAGLFDSVLRDALRVAHRFTRALAELLRCAGWDLAAAAAAAYPGVVYSKHGHCRYALLSRVCLSMFDGFDSYQFGGTSDTETPEGIELAIRRNESLQQFIEHSDADPMELMNSSPDCEFAQFCHRKYKQLIHPGVESSLFGNSDCRALPVMGAASPLYELFVAMAFRLKSLDRLLFQGIMMIFQGVIHHMNFRFVWHDKNNINMANPFSMEPAKSANSKEKSSNKKLKEIDGTVVSVGSGNSKKTMSSSGDYSAEGSSDVNDTKVSKTPRKGSLDDGPGAETAASAKMEDVLAPNHILGNTTISPNHCFPTPVIKPSATNVANSRAMGTPICPTPGVMVSSHTGVSTELSIKDERELKREKRNQTVQMQMYAQTNSRQCRCMHPAVMLNGFTSHQLKLIQQVLRKNFRDLVYVCTFGEDDTSEKRVVYTVTNEDKRLLMKDVQEDLLRSRETRVKSAVGIRHVIDLLASERKLIVGHSCFLDIAQVYSKFVGPRPSSMKEFALGIHKIFPHIADTRHLMSVNKAVQCLMRQKSKSLFSAFSLLCPALYSPVQKSSTLPPVRVDVTIPTVVRFQNLSL